MLTLHLPPEIEKKLRGLAARSGQSIEVYLQQIVEKEAKMADGFQPDASAPSAWHTTIPPDLRQWALAQFTEEEAVAGLRELREKGGLELDEFLPELKKIVETDEPTER